MASAAKTLVIVESPSKAKTIGKFLGSRYKVVASVGHVRDLPKSKLGIVLPEDLEKDNQEGKPEAEAFDPQYINIRGKGDLIKELKKEAKKASKIYLATDPDREGEAISWHLAYLLGIDEKTPCRIVFNEITSKAVKEAVKNPRPIDLSLVDAQQARRVLDRLVGYLISPLLWRKITRGLSAGRVQSAALKIICDREKEIQAFVPEEYWTIETDFKKGRKFTAKLATCKGSKLSLVNKEESDRVLAELEQGAYVVGKIEEKDRLRKPLPPYTTSGMQQEAANKLNFSTRKTMMVAQQLYEGVEIKKMGTVGLVSYIRTDSVRISAEAREAARNFILENYGDQYYGGTVFANKKKDVQDAHEAIRPSNVTLTPDSIKDQLSKDQYNLYKLIWQRFVASQMTPAKIKAVSAAINNGDYGFKASGSKVVFDGFLKVIQLSKGDADDKWLPDLATGEQLEPLETRAEQNFTQPPARFTEASLVKDLEEKDIGRPSTYAPIVATLMDRKYIKKEKKNLVPTSLGFTVTEMMEEYFKEIVDVGFTARMEDGLDDIETKDIRWKKIIEDYYGTLRQELDYADEKIPKMEAEVELTGEKCPECGKDLAIKHSRFGTFIGCTGYPDCKFTKPIVKKIEVKCPSCGGDIIMRRGKSGKLFYGCSNYPDCKQVYWDKPSGKMCPECGNMLVEKKGRNPGLVCSNKECNYKE
ncbi:MAG: type I DNA topoisomerase [Clostridiales bacterium]|nr:type I DNA topoisomerase [Clostridiales bacterium]